MKCTVVSVCNYAIIGEQKPTVQPGEYSIPAADPDLGIGVRVIEDGFCDEMMGATDTGYRTIRRVIPSNEIARSLVEDYIDGQLCLENGGKPGLFWVEGEYTPKQILKSFPDEIDAAIERHKIWAKNLITMADDLWSVQKKRRHIGQQMINAANFFGLEREWMDPTKFAASAIKCEACGKQLAPNVVICDNCKFVIDRDRFSQMQFA